ncbi:MAG: hypothetical protein HQ589_04755 [Syntrophaceae bacterium]|nr:hypothetical protein [Syntrophaceae bacterium]
MIPGTKRSICSLTDITSHKRAEKQIKESLKEKEVLLQEIHHRVKNNMQVISSLLSLQAGYARDERALDLFGECQNRIRTMALVHDMLYQSGDLASIDFADYIRSLTDGLLGVYSVDPDVIKLNIYAEGCFFGH